MRLENRVTWFKSHLGQLTFSLRMLAVSGAVVFACYGFDESQNAIMQLLQRLCRVGMVLDVYREERE